MSYFSQTGINDSNYLGKSLEITPMGDMRTSQVYRLVGTTFSGGTLDTNFWAATVANAGTVTQSGGTAILRTNTTANGSANLLSVRVGRYVFATANMYRAILNVGDTGATNNTRKWGVADAASPSNGAYFQLSGTTFSIVTLSNGTPTVVSSGSFNGTIGTTYTLDTNAHTFEIYYTNKTVYFTLDDQLLHKVTASTAVWSQTLHLNVFADNTNSSSATTDTQLIIRASSISRLGPTETQPIGKNLATNATTVLKYGPGNLHTIVLGNATGTVTIYDNTSATGTVIATITMNTGGASNIDFHRMPFNIGLTAVIAGGAVVTVIYE